jgi:hypothetical protein
VELHQVRMLISISLHSKTARANATPNINSVLATAVGSRGIRIAAASVRTSASPVQIAGHAGTNAPAGSSGQAEDRRHSSVSMGNASAKVSVATRMGLAIALNAQCHRHKVLEWGVTSNL